jgi:hypothetical protein
MPLPIQHSVPFALIPKDRESVDERQSMVLSATSQCGVDEWPNVLRCPSTANLQKLGRGEAAYLFEGLTRRYESFEFGVRPFGHYPPSPAGQNSLLSNSQHCSIVIH